MTALEAPPTRPAAAAATAQARVPAPPPAAPIDKRQRMLDATLRRYQYRQDALIEALHTAQNLYGYLTPDLLWYVAQQLRLPPSKVYGVATFYNFFTLKPSGTHTVVVCQGTACYIRGGPRLAQALRDAFDVASGQTTPDGKLSVLTARCLGSCGLAPAAVLDGVVLSRLTPQSLVDQVRAALAQPEVANVARATSMAGVEPLRAAPGQPKAAPAPAAATPQGASA